MTSFVKVNFKVELDRHRYFRSVSVFGIGIGVGILKYRGIGIGIGIGIFSRLLLFPVSVRSLSCLMMSGFPNGRQRLFYTIVFLLCMDFCMEYISRQVIGS